MTMTEPGTKSEDTKSLNSPTDHSSGHHSSSEEVNKIAHSANGGGGSTAADATDQNANTTTDPEGDDKKDFNRRSVTFPRDEDIVKSCLEPPDPWRNAPCWDLDELVLAYKRSCEKHGTKPLSNVLSQIQAFVNNGKRQEQLSLKGEKLDHKHLETLEEIFRRVQFKVLDFEGSHLDDESAVALFDMIEYYDSACHLSISNNKNIGARGWQACSRLIRRAPALSALEMRGCDFNERCVPILGRALKLGSPLTVLHLENTYLAGRSLTILVAALKMNETLQELFLADNRLMPSDGISLGSLLKFNHTLQMLDLRGNHLQDVGVNSIADGLGDQTSTTGLKTLVLWDNQITFQSMANLGRALAATECLQTLNLGRNNITNEGIHQLKEGLLKSRSLLRLGLQATKLTCEGAVALAEYVADSQKLLRLDLRLNDIKTAGMMALSLALRVNESVTRLDLDKEIKRDPGMKDFADQQMRLLRDVLTYQERNQQRALEREDTARRELEQRAEEEAAKRQAAALQAKESEAQASAMDDPLNMSDYIPTEDRIQRPKLLIDQRVTPQASLESPIVVFKDPLGAVKEEVTVNAAAAAAVASLPSLPTSSLTPLPLTGSKGLLSTPPPPDMLLSPQYFPRTTARKIFSVTRCPEISSVPAVLTPPAAVVTSMHGTPISSPMSPTPMPVIPSIDVMTPISPTSLCKDLELQTVDQYIKLITSESPVPVILGNPGGLLSGAESGGGGDAGLTESLLSSMAPVVSAVVTPSASEARVGGSGDGPGSIEEYQGEPGKVEADVSGSGDAPAASDSSLGDAATTATATTTTTSSTKSNTTTTSTTPSSICSVEASESPASSSLNGSAPSSLPVHSTDTKTSELVTPGEASTVAPSVAQDDSLQEETDVVSGNGQGVNEFVNGEASRVSKEEVSAGDASSLGEGAEEGDGETVLVEMSDSQDREETDSRGDRAPNKTETHMDSGIGSYDSDPWLTVESSDLQPQGRGQIAGSPEKPDFFTNLSLNGLTQELASALDGIDLDSSKSSSDAGPSSSS